MLVVFDIDGTVAEIGHRLHWIQTHPKNWGAFYAGISSDREITPVATLARNLYSSGHKLVFCTGRDEKHRQATLTWLAVHGLEHHGLYMRPDNDRRPDNEVKLGLINKIMSEHGLPDLVFEDRARNVAMFRSLGLICLQVAEGNF
jgi:hypothetical protein